MQVIINSDFSRILWLSPDEYWLLLNEKQKESFLKQKQNCKQIDNSHYYAILSLAGNDKEKLLAKCMHYDVYNMPLNKAITTTFANISATIFKSSINKKDILHKNDLGDKLKTEPNDVIYIIIRHSFANYVSDAIKTLSKTL